MLMGLVFRYLLEIMVLEKEVGRDFALIQINGSWYLTTYLEPISIVVYLKLFAFKFCSYFFAPFENVYLILLVFILFEIYALLHPCLLPLV